MSASVEDRGFAVQQRIPANIKEDSTTVSQPVAYALANKVSSLCYYYYFYNLHR
jgi:hypothetical protein